MTKISNLAGEHAPEAESEHAANEARCALQRMGFTWNGHAWELPQTGVGHDHDDWLLPLPEKIPLAVYRHPKLGALHDGLAMHMYAVGYAELVANALIARWRFKDTAQPDHGPTEQGQT